MKDSLSKVSSFYFNKKMEFQKKNCDFILKLKGKNAQTVTVDMSKYIGDKNAPIDIKFDKKKFTLKV